MKVTARGITIEVSQLRENITGSEAIAVYGEEFAGFMFIGRLKQKYQAAIRTLDDEGVDEAGIIKVMKKYDPTIIRARIAVDPAVAATGKAKKLCQKYFGDVDYDDIPAEMRDNIYQACLTEVTAAREKRAAKDGSN